MRVSVDRLRKGLLAGAGLLLLVIAGFLAFAHYRAHRFLAELPHKLGADIRQEANSYTWSQTVKGRTVFTVHAAKAIQHKDGKYTLHDVGITVYGRGEGKQNRIDHIYGKEFELDQTEGVVRAMGEVHLDLQAPASPSGSANGKNLAASPDFHEQDLKDSRLIHVKTSGLVYLQKLGVAATDQQIEFEYHGLTGHATGADYATDSGVLLLHSAVQVNGLERGQPVSMTASHGELNRLTRKVTLTQARFVMVGDDVNRGAARQTVEAQLATAFLRDDGSTERLMGEQGVTITTLDGAKITSQRGEVLLSESNKPASALLTGNVHYSAVDPVREANGNAGEARGSFDKEGRLTQVVFNGSVHLHERMAPEKPSGSATSRDLGADRVTLAMATVSKGRAWLQQVKANGNAHFQTISPDKKGNGTETNSIKGDALIARFSLKDGKSHLTEVKSDGSAALEQRSEGRSTQTASADSLDVTFRPSIANAAKGQLSPGGPDEVQNALLQGHVVIIHTSEATGAKAAVSESDRAIARKATYMGDTDRVLLTGDVQLENSGSTLWADRLTMDRKSGDATAEGSIKANYRQSNAAEALHVLADHADLKKGTDTMTFYGSATRPARFWQGSSQMQAPVLRFDRSNQRLTASGESHGAGLVVHTVLVSSAINHQGGHGLLSDGSTRAAAVVRIASREMVYSGESRTARFSGGVKVESADGVMLGQQATAFFMPEQEKRNIASKQQSSGFPSGSLDRVVMEGGIEIQQQARRATGERLVYGAGDGVYVLTGTDQRPPRVTDPAQGTVTGRELRFREQDASVVISNGEEDKTGPRVRTETRVKRER